MRTVLLLVLIVLIAAAPAYAQRRADLPSPTPPAVELTESGQPLSLSGLFNAQTLKIGHSYEFSYSSMAAGSVGLGVYTTSLQWQPSDRLAARVDVGVAHSPFGSGGIREAMGFSPDEPAQVYLRNAELAYRPTENSVLHLQVQQNPLGYGSPYGMYGYMNPYRYSQYGYAPLYPYYGTGVSARYGNSSDALFFRDGQ
ncbi:MAG: hypothetical protein R3284_00475 [Rubricoccaceae bacterium]|nr:hypothetical protein [Rubricoccaceae bacterium]